MLVLLVQGAFFQHPWWLLGAPPQALPTNGEQDSILGGHGTLPGPAGLLCGPPAIGCFQGHCDPGRLI